MQDFAASVLVEIERWMLSAGPNMFDMNTFVDSTEFAGLSTLDEMQKRVYTDEVVSVGMLIAVVDSKAATRKPMPQEGSGLFLLSAGG